MTAETADVLPFPAKPVASFVTVTPEIAARWLTRNTHNRHIRKVDLDRYKRDMLAGRWRLEGSPIRFANDGTLLDGQNRLTAIVETNVTITLLVVRGIEKDAQSVMDTGRKRTAADALTLEGHRNASLVAATAKFAMQVQAGKVWDGDGSFDASHEEILAFIAANPDLETSCDFIRLYMRKTDCRPTVVAYTYFILRRISEQDAAEFWVGVAEKAGLDKHNPILTLANRLAEARRRREFLSSRALLSMIYRAWNARRDGQRLTLLRVNSTSGGLIPIPKPH